MFPMKDDIVRLVGSRPPDLLKGRAAGDEPTLDDFKDLVGRMMPGETDLRDPI